MEGSSQFTPEPVVSQQVPNEQANIENLRSFDITNGTNVAQSSVPQPTPELVATQATELEHHPKVMHPDFDEKPRSPQNIVGKLEIAPGVDGPRVVMRPGDYIKKQLAKAARTLAASAAVMAGLGGALGSSQANAGDFNKSAENLLGGIATGLINNSLHGTAGSLRMDPNGGDPVLVIKSLEQQRDERAQIELRQRYQKAALEARNPPLIDTPAREVAAKLGLIISKDSDTTFSIINEKNKNDPPITIQKFHNPKHFTTKIQLEKVSDTELRLSTVYIGVDTLLHEQNVLISVSNGKISTR